LINYFYKESFINYSDRSRKSQEVHAEQLIKISTSLQTAFLLVLLVVPISSVIAASFNGSSDINAIGFFLKLFGSWFGGVFILSEIFLVLLVNITRRKALDIYDELYPDSLVDS